MDAFKCTFSKIPPLDPIKNRPLTRRIPPPIPRALGGSKKWDFQFWTPILLWCRLWSPKVDALFGSSQGSGCLVHPALRPKRLATWQAATLSLPNLSCPTRGSKGVITGLIQGAQYGLVKEFGLNYIGIHNTIQGIFLNYATLGSLGYSSVEQAPR